jgi:hypothetical protein
MTVRILPSLPVLFVVALIACSNRVPASPPATDATPEAARPTERVVGPLSDADAAALATMHDGLEKYVALHRKIEGALPKLPVDADVKQRDSLQRQFEAEVRKERSGAKHGDLFTPQAQPVIKRLIAAVFEGPEGQKLKASIMDENPVDVKIGVNARYPDNVPISTMPPPVLQTLPKLTEDLEYRFVNDNLIILDVHAHVIADFIENVLPPTATLKKP